MSELAFKDFIELIILNGIFIILAIIGIFKVIKSKKHNKEDKDKYVIYIISIVITIIILTYYVSTRFLTYWQCAYSE